MSRRPLIRSPAGPLPRPRGARRCAIVVGVLLLAARLLDSALAADDAAVRQAQALLADYQEDPGRLQQARLLLEEATRSDPQPEPLALLSRVWFLIGQALARTPTE